MSLLDRISIDSSVRFGKPCVRGTRITVGDVLGYLAGGTSEEQLLKEFPQLMREDAITCGSRLSAIPSGHIWNEPGGLCPGFEF